MRSCVSAVPLKRRPTVLLRAAWYRDPKNWKCERRADYLPDGQCTGTQGDESMWTFEPSAALAILERWERENGLEIVRGEWLDRAKGGVAVVDGRIVSFRTLSGRTFRGKVFVDATYEGDLMAAAGVSYAVGPANYDPLDYELLLRNLEAIDPKVFAENADKPDASMPWINSRMPNRKTDTNNRRGFSTDFIGGSWDWPEASYAERERILQRHLDYQMGLMWTLANDPRVPEPIRTRVARWGTCRDEFADGLGHGWQRQLYVREARRLVGEYVMNEGNVEDSSANPPGQPFRRFGPYPIDYGAIVPRGGGGAGTCSCRCASRRRTWRSGRSAWSRCSSRSGRSRARRRRWPWRAAAPCRTCRTRRSPKPSAAKATSRTGRRMMSKHAKKCEISCQTHRLTWARSAGTC